MYDMICVSKGGDGAHPINIKNVLTACLYIKNAEPNIAIIK